MISHESYWPEVQLANSKAGLYVSTQSGIAIIPGSLKVSQ